jgi:CheY-like chemotaxis protein
MPRILVVEDEGPNVEILRRLLSRNGYEVVVAGSRDDALEAMADQPADLVLMDIGIPNADGEPVNDAGGLEATRRLKAQPQTQAVPIIAISAYAMLDEKKRFLAAGCDDVQSKPFDFTGLLQAVKMQLEKSR